LNRGDITTNTFNLQLRVNLPPRFNLVFEPSYRIEHGRGGDRDLITLRLEASYRLGELHFRLQGLHEFGEQAGENIGQTFVSFYAERRW